MASTVVAVAGGTGQLGRAVVERLIASNKFEVIVLAREASESRSKEIGANLVAVDYNNVDSLVRTLEENSIDTVISTLGSMFGAGPELALIEASDKSKATKRYIPSTWGIRCTPELAAVFPPNAVKVEYLKALEATSLEYTAVNNGFFLDYFVIPHVKSYLGGITMALDIANKAAGIPGSGEVPVAFTYSFDVGDFVAALLTQSAWGKDSYTIGDKVTWNEFLAIAEEARGAKFDTAYDSMEKLKSSQVTELPAHISAYAYMPKPMLQGFMAAFGLMFEQGAFDFKFEGSLNDQFPEIKTRKVKDLVNEAWKGK